jgi:hypothetical protein
MALSRPEMPQPAMATNEWSFIVYLRNELRLTTAAGGPINLSSCKTGITRSQLHIN